MASEVRSFVNPSKSFSGDVAVSIIDRQVWESRVLLIALLQALGLDPQRIINDAINADNNGGDILTTITASINAQKGK